MKQAIEGVLKGMLAGVNAENVSAYEAVSSSEEFVELAEHLSERLPDRFGMCVQNGPLRAVEGLLVQTLKGNSQAKFLFLHADYVESQVRKQIERSEGFQCGADKTRTVLRALARHLVDGDPIAFDYAGKVTYHLPTKTLKSQEEIVGFFDSVRRLYYGDPLPYLRHLTEYGLGQEADEL